MQSHYQYHVFFCTNLRPDRSQSCQQCDALAMRNHAKQRSKELGLVRSGQVRINTAGCLNRCELGPVMVIYPEATWYTYVDQEDIDEIIDQHLVKGRVVKRLLIDKPPNNN